MTDAILELAEAAGDRGISMGAVVERLEARGLARNDIELEIWAMLQRRRLTPCGFIARTLRRRDPQGNSVPTRVYEFMLVPWSPSLDGQLDLKLDRNP